MNTQNFKQVKDESSATFYQQVNKTKKLHFLLFAICPMLLLFSCSKNNSELPNQANVEASVANQSSHAQVSNYVESVPFERILYVPCGNGGAGEAVSLTGTLKFVEEIVYNDHGFTFNYHVIAQGVTGVGLTTGENYQASGGNKGNITGEFGEVGQYTRLFIDQLRIIGQNSVFTVMYKTKMTITPDGKITTSIEEENVDCRM